MLSYVCVVCVRGSYYMPLAGLHLGNDSKEGKQIRVRGESNTS